MAKKGSFSKVYDKNGDYVDVEAARFDGTRTFQMQGDVSATQTWNGDSASALTLNTSIGAKKVTTDKINDKAVQTGQIDDGAVGLTQIATNAMNGTVQDNDSKLATHSAVKTYVDSQISGQGTYLGKHTVAEINAMVTDNLHNGDRVMTSDSGTINLGPGGVGFDVEAGEDLILYKSGSTVQWDSMDGNFKTKQTAVSDPTASGTGLTFIDSASQDENGEMTLSKKTVQDGTTSQKGVVQLEDSHSSTSTTKAATPNSVKEAYDLASTANSGLANKQDKPSSATENNIATFNGSKSTKDSGKAFLPSTSTWDGDSDDKVPTAKAVQAQLDGKAAANKVVAIADAMIRRAGQTGSGWYKFAELSNNNTYDNVNFCFDVYASTDSRKLAGRLDVAIRTGNSAGASVGIPLKKFYSDAWLSDYKFKIVIRGLTGSATIELWASCLRDFGGLAISERNSSTYTANNIKNRWTYTSYENNGGSAAPVTDAGNNVTVTDVDIVYRQHAVSNATSGNFAGLDSNGLLTDSGKKAADFEQVANKVTSVRDESSATDTAYPSEKAVATAISSGYKYLGVLTSGDLNDKSNIGYYSLAGTFTNLPSNAPSSPVYGTLMNLYADGSSVARTQILYLRRNATKEDMWIRHYVNLPKWGSWRRVLRSDEVTSTYSSTGTNPLNGTAVASALSSYELLSNKVSSWQTTPDNTHYPSEKLVKDGLDAKADTDKVVAIADAKVYRAGQSGGGWYKIAECSINKGTRNISASWDVLAVNQVYSNSGKIALNYRYENSTGTFSRTNVRLDVDSWDATRNSIKVTHQLTTDKIIFEIWVNSADTYSGFAISERNSDNYSVDNVKGIWTYTSYIGNGGSSAPVPDATNNVVVTDVEIVYRQHAIASPTNDNLVAMDANGIVKDSGLTKSSVESAITSAGSAIQGVKVNNTTLTPDANKVVTVPLATTSADGAMSAADKTKLDNAVTKKTGLAYRATQGSEVFKIAEMPYRSRGTHSEQYVFHVAYSRHSSNVAISELNILLKIVENSDSEVTVFRNTVTSKQGFGALDWTFKASADDTNGLFTLYAVRTAGQYTTVEATCTEANSERNNLIDDVVVFSNTTAELPETVFTETTLFSANSASSSGTAPVKVDAYGALTPVPMDATPTASSTNLMTSGDIKNALDLKAPIASPALTGTPTAPTAASGTNTTQIATTAFVQGAISSETSVGAVIGAANSSADSEGYYWQKIGYFISTAWSRASAVFTSGRNDTIAEGMYVVGAQRLSDSAGAPTKFTIEFIGGLPQNAASRSFYYTYNSSNNVCTLYTRTRLNNNYSFCAIKTQSFTWYKSSDATAVPDLETIKIDLLSSVYSKNWAGEGSSSVPVYVDTDGQVKACTDDFVHDGDVAQTYSSTSEAPISGKGVFSAVSNLTYKQIPVGLKYDMVVANETSTSPILCYEISNIGLTTQYSSATAEIVVYQYTAQGSSQTNINSYKVAVHWDRGSVICIVEGCVPTGTWTAMVENSSTPSTTDVSTLKLYFVPKTYTTYRLSIVSCKRRGSASAQYIFEGDISIKNVQENIPAPSSLVIVGTTTTRKLLSDSDVKSTYIPTGSGSTDPINGVGVSLAIVGKQDALSFMTTAEAHSLWTNAKANAS